MELCLLIGGLQMKLNDPSDLVLGISQQAFWKHVHWKGGGRDRVDNMGKFSELLYFKWPSEMCIGFVHYFPQDWLDTQIEEKGWGGGGVDRK
jgi:hypothetical protein